MKKANSTREKLKMAKLTSRDTESSTQTVEGSMNISGNLIVNTQITTNGLKVLSTDDYLPMLSATGSSISFKKTCEFLDNVQFNNGQTIIGTESTYKTAYVGSPTIQAGNRLIVGDSVFKVTGDDREIIADTFKMSLGILDADKVISDKEITELLQATKAQISSELIANTIYADTIKTNELVLENISGLNLKASENLTTKDLIVGGSAKIQNDLTIVGSGTTGTALTINGGQLVANYGIVSNTANNLFQTMRIMGSGTSHDICFRIDKYVDSVIEGDVTIQDSTLYLDNSKLVSDNLYVTSLSSSSRQSNSGTETSTTGVLVTTDTDFDTYKDTMVTESTVQESLEDTYDPYEAVTEAVERNATNYNSIEKTVKSLLNPISYVSESSNSSLPKKFNVKSGIYRLDTNGNMMMRNMYAESGKFSSLEAYKLNVNRLSVDKLVLTSVASNVVATDNLLKSTGIAEFDGVVNTSADIFIENGSSVNVAKDASITLQSGSSLTLKNGASFEMGTNTSVKMAGDIELDIAKLVFVDSDTGNRYKIGFKELCANEGGGLVMTYSKVETATSKEVIAKTSRDANELNSKLKSLGI